MDFLPPLSIEINDEKNEDKIPKEIFDLPYENKIYSIEILIKSNSMKISALEKNKISTFIYENSFSLLDLQKLSKIFKMCDNITDAFEIILPKFKNNEIKIIFNDDIFNLCTTFTLPNNKNDEIKISLKSIKVKESIIIEKLIENISLLQQKNDNLENEVKSLKLEIDNLKDNKKNENHTKLLDLMEKLFFISKYQISNLINKFFIDRLQGKENDYQDYLMKILELNTTILFDSKVDEDSISYFVNKVYGKSNIVCFISICIKKNHDIKYFYVFFFFKEKLELVNDVFDINKNKVFGCGNRDDNNEYDCDILNRENMRFNIKIEKNYIYVRMFSKEKQFEEKEKEEIPTILIEDNFMKNPIAIIENQETPEFSENTITIKELKVYQIEIE